MGKQSGDLGEVSFVLMKRIVKLEMGVREECVYAPMVYFQIHKPICLYGKPAQRKI